MIGVQANKNSFDLRSIGFNKSLIISVIFHVVLIVILSITIKKLPTLEAPIPIEVNIATSVDSVARGMAKSLQKPVMKNTPKMTERTTKSVEKQAIPDKVKPKKSSIKPIESNQAIKDSLKKLPKVDDKQNLQKEVIKSDQIKEPSDTLDKFMEADEQKQLDDVADDILKDDLNLDKPQNDPGKSQVGRGDPLSDATWQAKPRKTLAFPDIASKIPAKYKKEAKGYAVTVHLSFNKQGLCTKVDILKSSGDSTIDAIFKIELRKIKVEEIQEDRVDKITKEFKISVK